MPLVTLKQLLEAGVHFGHQTSRWNPKMKRYIFTARNGIHIIDLQQTVKLLDDASTWVKDVVGSGRLVLFIDSWACFLVPMKSTSRPPPRPGSRTSSAVGGWCALSAPRNRPRKRTNLERPRQAG